MKWYCIFICLTYHGWLDSCLMPYNLRYRTWWSWPPFCIQPTSSINCLISLYSLIWDFLYAPQQYALMFGLSYLNHLDMSSWYEHPLQSICILQHSPISVWFYPCFYICNCLKMPKRSQINEYSDLCELVYIVQQLIAMYSTSIENLAIICCHLLFHETTPSLTKKRIRKWTYGFPHRRPYPHPNTLWR